MCFSRFLILVPEDEEEERRKEEETDGMREGSGRGKELMR